MRRRNQVAFFVDEKGVPVKHEPGAFAEKRLIQRQHDRAYGRRGDGLVRKTYGRRACRQGREAKSNRHQEDGDRFVMEPYVSHGRSAIEILKMKRPLCGVAHKVQSGRYLMTGSTKTPANSLQSSTEAFARTLPVCKNFGGLLEVRCSAAILAVLCRLEAGVTTETKAPPSVADTSVAAPCLRQRSGVAFRLAANARNGEPSGQTPLLPDAACSAKLAWRVRRKS